MHDVNDLTSSHSPFVPGTGHAPPVLAGREKETELLELVLSRLLGDRDKKENVLVEKPYPPIRIVGPRGVGKTVLLNWMQQRARKHKIPVFKCAFLRRKSANAEPLQHLITAMEKGGSLLSLIREFKLDIPITGGGIGFVKDQPEKAYSLIVEAILAKKPMLLLLDEVHHFGLDSLTELLQVNQQLISDGYPLGMVLAGTPGLDRHLRKTDATFIVRSESIYINTLSKDATRDALLSPFVTKGATVTPEAFEAMVAQTDNYPYFIQLVGQAVWRAMEKTGKKEVTAELVAQSSEQARKKRVEIYNDTYVELRKGRLLEYASQVVELLESNDGSVIEGAVVKALAKNPELVGDQAEEIYERLRETGFIWAVEGRTEPGIPSFFSYFKATKEEEDRFT